MPFAIAASGSFDYEAPVPVVYVTVEEARSLLEYEADVPDRAVVAIGD